MTQNQMSKRLATYLPDGIYDYLEQWANKEKRSVSNLAAYLLETVVRERTQDGADSDEFTVIEPQPNETPKAS